MSIHSQARSSEYHALQTKLQKRTSSGYWYLVSHTWSQTLTTQPAPGIGGNFTYDTGPAAFDIPHLLPMSFGAELPFGRGKRFLGGAGTLANALVGGWQAQSIVNYRSGLPFTPTVSRDVANTGVRAGSGPIRSAPASSRPDDRRVVRQDRVRRAARTLRTETPGAASSAATTSGTWISRCSSDSACRIAGAGVQGGGVQPAELGVLRSAEHGHRYTQPAAG